MSWGGKGGRGTTVPVLMPTSMVNLYSIDCVPAWGYFRQDVATELDERWKCEYCRSRNSEVRDECRSCGAPAP